MLLTAIGGTLIGILVFAPYVLGVIEMQTPPQTWTTARLSLRPPARVDAPRMFEDYARDPRVTRYLTWRPHESVERMYTFIERSEKSWVAGTEYSWSIWSRAWSNDARSVQLTASAEHRGETIAGSISKHAPCGRSWMLGNRYFLDILGA